jgi:hypothetical protein
MLPLANSRLLKVASLKVQDEVHSDQSPLWPDLLQFFVLPRLAGEKETAMRSRRW